MGFRSSMAVSLLFALVVCSNTLLHGQGTDLGTIRGTVTDSSGALVAQAAVIVTPQPRPAAKRRRMATAPMRCSDSDQAPTR